MTSLGLSFCKTAPLARPYVCISFLSLGVQSASANLRTSANYAVVGEASDTQSHRACPCPPNRPMKTNAAHAIWNTLSACFQRDHRLKACATLFLIAGSALAGPRTSANYSIAADTIDSGGQRAASANYTNAGSTALIAGASSVGPSAGTATSGFIGELNEVVGFLVNASPSTLNEGGTRQLDAWQLLDDATYLAVASTAVSWSSLSGAITSVSTTGLATAGIVYRDTLTTVRGTYLGDPSFFALLVLNVGVDDFGAYSGDLIDDDWQVLHFGLPPNPAAGPLLDPDGDGQNNRFEWIAGLIPTDAASVFKLSIVRNAGNAILRFGPTVAGRTYTVKYGFDFLIVPNWPTLPNGIVTGVASELLVTDPNAAASPRKFYRVEVAK